MPGHRMIARVRAACIAGAFYLDRTPQPKHIAGPFFTEGSYTKNSPEEVDALMRLLKEHSS